MKTVCVAILALIALPLTHAMAGGRGNPELKKAVVIDAKASAALTNRTEILLHQTRLPEVDFRQACIDDIVHFLNAAAKEYAKTDEAKQVMIVLDPATQKELMKYEEHGSARGIFHLFTFGGLDMSVLEAITVLQEVAQLDRRADGQRLILSMKKEKQVQQPSAGDSSTRAARVSEPPEK